MPLYEALIIAKAGPAQDSVYMLRHLVKGLLTKYPYAKVREVQNMGDRVMGKALKVGEAYHNVGRYLQILYDGCPEAHLELQRLSKVPPFNKEVFRMYSHRIKDEAYPLHLYMKAARLSDLVGTDPEERNLDFAKKVAEIKKRLA